jgi:hypothetical protein
MLYEKIKNVIHGIENKVFASLSTENACHALDHCGKFAICLLDTKEIR